MNDQLTITRYGTRNWAIYWNGELLAVTVYKKGAKAVAETISALLRANDSSSSPA
jgi:hypothetical protein